MAKKKALSRKTVKKTLDCGDMVVKKQNDFEEETFMLRQQISQMQEHSMRLISAYNKKLDILRRENEQLSECMRTCVAPVQVSNTMCGMMTPYEMTKAGLVEVDELRARFSSALTGLLYVHENYDAASALVNCLKTEVSDLNTRITDQETTIENIKRFVMDNYPSEIVNQTSILLEGEIGTRLLVQDELEDHMLKDDELILESDESDARTEHTEFGMNINSRKDVDVDQISMRNKELEQMLLFERKASGEQLSALRTLFSEQNLKNDTLIVNVNDLNAKYTKAVRELKSMSKEMEVMKRENNELLECKQLLSDQLEKYEKNTQELSVRYEDECSKLHEEKLRLSELCKDLESTICDSHRTEHEKMKDYEELTKRYEHLQNVISNERKEFDRQLIAFRKASAEEIQKSNELINCLKERITSEKRAYELVVDSYNTKMATLKRSFYALQQEKERKCEQLMVAMAEVVKLNDELLSVNEKLSKCELKVIELRSSISATEMENQRIKEEVTINTYEDDLILNVWNAHFRTFYYIQKSENLNTPPDLLSMEGRLMRIPVKKEEFWDSSVEKPLNNKLTKTMKNFHRAHQWSSNECVAFETSKRIDPDHSCTSGESKPTRQFNIKKDRFRNKAFNENMEEDNVDWLHREAEALPFHELQARNEIWKQAESTKLSEDQVTMPVKAHSNHCIEMELSLEQSRKFAIVIAHLKKRLQDKDSEILLLEKNIREMEEHKNEVEAHDLCKGTRSQHSLGSKVCFFLALLRPFYVR
ncbi:hypothetical protein KIN20_035465 [Parelaphostrongylus tenuis]|uniref:Uncharacterized protein n=1 Tax=Parelaphostrongylus tenuis TaxID=148309 RepID=A0AAD5WKJ3_PARTN|nr:hypothetical protein KIN20_035465 [Parelaphostrongylus tenuis]